MTAFPPCDDVCGAVEEHVRRSFAGHEIETVTWSAGPITEANPHFRVARAAPASVGELWTYISIGGWAATGETSHGLEFLLSVEEPTPRAVELLAMTVFYNRAGRLGWGHTVPLGEPWLPGSRCDHFLLSTPYPFDPELERCHVGDRHIDFLWLLPITAMERDFKVTHGLESLEVHFEEAGLEYWQVDRNSTV